MQDTFKNHATGLDSPARDLFEIRPSDTTDLPQASRALNVAVTGSVRVTTVGGTTATVFVAAGIPFPVRAKRVWSTGTTAVDIVALS